MRIETAKKIQLQPDEALLVVVRGIDEIGPDELQEIKKSLVAVIPNADMGRVSVIALPDGAEIDLKPIKMEKKA